MTDVSSWREHVLAAIQNEASRQPALDALVELPEEERAERIDARLSGALVLLLGDPSRTRQRRAADALGPLVPHAPALAKALRAALSALEPRLRWGAAYTLGHALRPPTADLWPAVRETLSLEDGDQRWAAAELTCELARHHPTIRDDVAETARTGSATMRRMALYCLRDLGDPDLLAIACEGLSDASPGVRLAALAAGTRAERSESESTDLALRVAALVERDGDAGVRRAAAATLGRIACPSERARTALRTAANSPDPSLARAARAALQRLESESSRN